MEITRERERHDQAKPSKGKSFLAESKARHHELFRDYVRLWNDFEGGIQEFCGALETDCWILIEEITKQSWRNGVIQGEKRVRR